MKEEENTGTPEEEQNTPTFTDTLIETFLEAWQPAHKNEPGAELKSTLEIIEEMATMHDVQKQEVNTSLKDAGFKPTYVDGAFYWMLKPNNSPS